MKEKLCAIFLAVIVGIVGYIAVSTAAKHTAMDNAALYKWHVQHTAIHP